MDANEVGISGALVTLRRDTGGDGRDTSDPILGTLNTDADGFYVFPNVAPATNYFVCVDLASTGLVASSGPNTGNHPPSGTEENQTNGDDGTELTPQLICSQVFDVVASGMPTDDILTPIGYTNNNANMKVDFGFTSIPTAIGLSSFGVAETSSALPALLLFVLIMLTSAVLLRWVRTAI